LSRARAGEGADATGGRGADDGIPEAYKKLAAIYMQNEIATQMAAVIQAGKRRWVFNHGPS
jgi:hypothetical protein